MESHSISKEQKKYVTKWLSDSEKRMKERREKRRRELARIAKKWGV